MKPPPSRDDRQRILKLAGLPDEIRQSRFVAVTRLSVLKSLCRESEVAHRFVVHLARRTFDAMEQPKSAQPTATASTHREMMVQALEGMGAWLRSPDEKCRRTLSALHGRMRDEQNEHRNIPYGAVRLITDTNLLLFEYDRNTVEGNTVTDTGGEDAAAVDVQSTTANLVFRNNTLKETRGPARRVGFRLGKDTKDITLDGNTVEGFAAKVDDKRK